MARRQQINVTLSDSMRAILDAVAFLEDVTPTAYLKSVAIAHLESRAAEERVRRAAQTKAEYQAMKRGELSDIDQQRNGTD